MSIRKFGEPERIESWARRVNEIMDEMINRDYVEYRDTRMWRPPTNVYECGRSYYVVVEIGGMDRSEIDVQCTGPCRVTVSGERPMPRPAEAAGDLCTHVMEIDEGGFRREIELPEPLDVDGIEATYEKGYLWIKLPKKN